MGVFNKEDGKFLGQQEGETRGKIIQEILMEEKTITMSNEMVLKRQRTEETAWLEIVLIRKK